MSVCCCDDSQANFVSALCAHLVASGYEAHENRNLPILPAYRTVVLQEAQITVLSPYLGQVGLLRNNHEKGCPGMHCAAYTGTTSEKKDTARPIYARDCRHCCGQLSGQDAFRGLFGGKSNTVCLPAARCEGEENDIIVISLVRSNRCSFFGVWLPGPPCL